MRHETYCVFDILDVQIKVNIFFFKLANNTPTPKKKKQVPPNVQDMVTALVHAALFRIMKANIDQRVSSSKKDNKAP